MNEKPLKRIGIIKKIDSLGRIVIPKTIRERLSLNNGAEILLAEEGLLIRATKKEDDNI